MTARRITTSACMLVMAACTVLAGCGQKGALYLPDASGEVVTRPMQTPEATPTPTDGEATPAPSEPKKPAAPPAIPPATP